MKRLAIFVLLALLIGPTTYVLGSWYFSVGHFQVPVPVATISVDDWHYILRQLDVCNLILKIARDPHDPAQQADIDFLVGIVPKILVEVRTTEGGTDIAELTLRPNFDEKGNLVSLTYWRED